MSVSFVEVLPDVDIAISTEPRLFLNEIAPMAATTFKVEVHLNAIGETNFDVINLRFLGCSPHMNIGVQLIARPGRLNRIFVELRAEKWSPDPPTRAAYVEAARMLVSPLLADYNRVNATRYRLRIAKLGSDKMKLTARTASNLRRFALLANQSSLHALDWRRFYEFVRHSRQQLPEEMLHHLLVQEGFLNSTAARLSEVYRHLWAYKRLR